MKISDPFSFRLLAAIIFLSTIGAACSSKWALQLPDAYAGPRTGDSLKLDLAQLQPLREEDKKVMAGEGKNRLVVYTKTDCSLCAAIISLWNDILIDTRWDTLVDVIFISHGQSISTLEYFVFDDIGIDYPTFYDAKNLFAKENQISKDVDFHGFLIDGENKIRTLGNPAVDSLARIRFDKMIRKMEKKKASLNR